MSNVIYAEFGNFVTCDICGTVGQGSVPGISEHLASGSTLTLSGGYAEFWDDLFLEEDELRNDVFTLNICHTCTLPIFRAVMHSAKYGHMHEEYLGVAHVNEAAEGKCCEYSYDMEWQN